MRQFLLLAGVAISFLAWCLVPTRAVNAQSGPAVYTLTFSASYQYHLLRHPAGLAIGSTVYPDLYIADSGNAVIRKFSNGTLSIVAGTGVAGYQDGTTASAQFYRPTGLWGGTLPSTISFKCGTRTCTSTQPHTDLTISDGMNYVVRHVCKGSVAQNNQFVNCDSTTTVVGNHVQGFQDGSATTAEFSTVGGLFPNGAGGFYVVDSLNHSIRVWNAGTLTTFAGTGAPGYVNGYRTSAMFNCPGKVTFDNSGNMYVADMGNYVIRKIDSAGNVTTFAGSGVRGMADGAGTAAQFNMPSSVVFNFADNFLYVVDAGNHAIRKIDLAGNVTTYAGTGRSGLVDGALNSAQFNCPMDLVIQGGFMYISDTLNNAIRRIDMSSGTVSTYIS